MTDKLLSKISLVLLLTLIAAACSKTIEPPPNVEAPIVSAPTISIPTISVPAFKLESLSQEQRKAFEKAFPSDARKAFEDSEVILIYGKRMGNEPPVVLKSASERRAFLDSIYWDLANSIRPKIPNTAAPACKESGPMISSSKPSPDAFSIVISYTCGYFDLSSPKGFISSHFSARSGLSRPLIRDLFRRENRPDPQLEMP